LVLLVEDSSELRETVAEALGGEGFYVREASNGREAIDRARSLLPDVIVMDLSLPVLDGASAARVIKTYAPTADTRIVAFTGMSVGPSDALALGLDGVIRKPCDPPAMAAALRSVLERGPRRRRGA
jgi:CheY-like chemotaxis protein